MEKNPIGEGRELLIDQVNLEEILAGGPSAPKSDVSGEIPPMPEAAPAVPVSQPVSVETQEPVAPAVNEGPDEEMKAQMIMPSEPEKAALKAKYGSLRVVPVPYTRDDDKVQVYILRQLTRSQWRSMEDAARKIAESKPGVLPEEIFQEKIIATACVWPSLPEHQIAASPPGLVPTLFGVVQQMGLFFNPDVIMSMTFPL